MKELINILSEEFKVQPYWYLIQDQIYDLFLERRIDARTALMAIQQVSNRFRETLQPGYFVPCNEKGEVLEEPTLHTRQIGFDEWEDYYDEKEVEEYQKAKESVIYEGYELEFNTDYAYQLNTIKKYPFDEGEIKIDECVMIYKNKESKTISSMEGQPITKQFFNFLQ